MFIGIIEIFNKDNKLTKEFQIIFRVFIEHYAS